MLWGLEEEGVTGSWDQGGPHAMVLCFLLAWECLPGSYSLFQLLVLRWGDHTQKAQSVVPLITLPMGFSPVSWLLRKQCTSPPQEMF